MKQRQLEERVREIFEQQGFEVEETENGFRASGETSFDIEVFSSEKFDFEDVEPEAEDALVFVDEELSEVASKLENEVSVIKEQDEEEYDLPSFEIIGDVAIISELVDLSRDEAVEGILKSNPNVETILLKTDPLDGEFRVGSYEKLHGDETETVHREFGCRFKVDLTKVYFSERFSTERKRVVDQIEDGERVLVMFAGVGPFAVMAAKHADPSQVVAVEKNPEAVQYMRENIELNSVGDVVEAYEGDVEDVVPSLDGKFDRIVMPLPGMADEFMGLALNSINEEGVIHYYRFMEEGGRESLLDEVEEAASEVDRGAEVRDITVCGERGPSVDRVCLDIRIS